jgi:hypothetical protein
VRERIRIVVALAAWALLFVLLPGCLDTHTWVEKKKPWDDSTFSEDDRVRVIVAGTQITIDEPRIQHDASGDVLTGREVSGSSQRVEVKLASVRSLEVRKVDAGKLGSGIIIGLVALAAIGLYLFGPFSPSST